MNDRELLELAAKAAGIVGSWEKRGGFVQDRWYFNVQYDNQNMLSGFEWNPLTDDGDALRLAVKLGFDVDVEYERTVVRGEVNLRIFDLEEPHENDPCAATRRAIVRAAAEIGKAMK